MEHDRQIPMVKDASKAGIMSVTELAKQVGVSVRTIQYYDQMGLLSPNAKGPHNERLYTDAERQQFYRILVLKYLGYSLKEIREGAGPVDVANLRPFLRSALDKLEPEFLELFRRLSTLRKLVAESYDEIEWDALAHIIEDEDNGPLYWQALSIHDAQPTQPSNVEMQRDEVKQWHALCREAMSLMQSGVPASFPEARRLAQRFAAMGGVERAREGVNLMVTSLGSHAPMNSSVPAQLIDGIIDYLTAAGSY